MRRMALEAGVGESIVNGIIKLGMGARPETLKALADRWGTPADYAAMMRLAGHPVPNGISDPGTREMLQLYEQMSSDQRDYLRTVATQYAPDVLVKALRLAEKLVNLVDTDGELPREEFQLSAEELDKIALDWDSLFQFVMRLSPNQRQRWVADSILALLSESSTDDSEDLDVASS